MKLLIKLIVLVLVLGYASLFILKKPDGTPIRTLDSLIPSFALSSKEPDEGKGVFSRIGDSVTSFLAVFKNVGNESSTDVSATDTQIDIEAREIYRWQDEQGAWHYTDSPPPGVEAQIMDLQAPPVMNLFPATSDEEPEENAREDVQTAENETSLIPERLREIQSTLQQAEAVKEQFQEKLEEQQRILEEL